MHYQVKRRKFLFSKNGSLKLSKVLENDFFKIDIESD